MYILSRGKLLLLQMLVVCLPESLIIKRENQISDFVLQKGPSEREGLLRQKSSKMHTSVIFCCVSLGVVKSLSSLRAFLCVFELCGFRGGVGKRTRRRATPSSSPRRRRLRRMDWSRARRTSSRSGRGRLPATGASAAGSSSKPAQCVSASHYCQPLSLKGCPDQGIRGSKSIPLLRALPLIASSLGFGNAGHIVTLHLAYLSLLPGGGAEDLQASEIHGFPCLEKSCIYRNLV